MEQDEFPDQLQAFKDVVQAIIGGDYRDFLDKIDRLDNKNYLDPVFNSNFFTMFYFFLS